MSMKEKFFKAAGVKTETVAFPELGGMKLLIKQLSAKRFMELCGPEVEQSAAEQDNFLAAVIVECVYDPDTGERFLGHDDIDAMMDGSIEALKAVGNKVMEINGIGNNEETLRKN